MKSASKWSWEKLSQVVTVVSFPLLVATIIFGYIQLRDTERQIGDLTTSTSLQNMLTVNGELFNDTNTGIIAAIGDGKPILTENGGKFSDYQLDNYLGIFDSIAQIRARGGIAMPEIAESFSYYIITTYENREIQEYLARIRKLDPDFFTGLNELYRTVKSGKTR